MCKRIKTVCAVLMGIRSDFKYLSVLTGFDFFLFFDME